MYVEAHLEPGRMSTVLLLPPYHKKNLYFRCLTGSKYASDISFTAEKV